MVRGIARQDNGAEWSFPPARLYSGQPRESPVRESMNR